MGCCGKSGGSVSTRGRSRVIDVKAKKNQLALFKTLSAKISIPPTILMCPPDYYGIEYSINPWMDVKDKVDRKLAQKQWEALHNKIIELGAKIELIKPQKNLPDMVFTANAGLVFNKKVILSRFKHPERQGEEKFFEEWFLDHGYEVLFPENYFEGAGDCLLSKANTPRFFCGYGFRSDEKIIKFLEDSFSNSYEEFVLNKHKLINSYFYHIDTCFCPLTCSLWGDGFLSCPAMAYPGAFEPESFKRMREDFLQFIEVDEDEAKLFACNAVTILRNIILPEGCEKTAKKLEEIGFNSHFVPMSEFIKAGGACKCLTLEV